MATTLRLVHAQAISAMIASSRGRCRSALDRARLRRVSLLRVRDDRTRRARP